MANFYGNTSTSATQTFTCAATIKTFNITNKTGGAVTINVSILYGSTNTWITPYNKSVAMNDFYEDDKEIDILPGSSIYVQVSGNCDFYFSIR